MTALKEEIIKEMDAFLERNLKNGRVSTGSHYYFLWSEGRWYFVAETRINGIVSSTPFLILDGIISNEATF